MFSKTYLKDNEEGCWKIHEALCNGKQYLGKKQPGIAEGVSGRVDQLIIN